MRFPYAHKLCSLYLLLMRKLLTLWLSPAECHQMCQNQNHAAISSFPESHQYYTILLHLYTTQYFRIVGFTLCQKQTCQIYMQKYFDGFKTNSKWIICTYVYRKEITSQIMIFILYRSVSWGRTSILRRQTNTDAVGRQEQAKSNIEKVFQLFRYFHFLDIPQKRTPDVWAKSSNFLAMV